jgi:hypothetical protein
MSNLIEQQIFSFVRENCPCFAYDGNGGSALWHKCSCMAQKSITIGYPASCDCVWHETNMCVAGEWNMPFLKEVYEESNERIQQYKNRLKDVSKEILTPAGKEK